MSSVDIPGWFRSLQQLNKYKTKGWIIFSRRPFPCPTFHVTKLVITANSAITEVGA